MYYYLYDSFVGAKKYQSEIFHIEARLADLGIQGRIGRLTSLKSADEMIGRAIEQGATTIVAVGNDETVTRVIRMIIDARVTLGIIPVEGPGGIASFFGIPRGVVACDILSSRIIEKMDVGRINNTYFLSSVHIPNGGVSLKVNNAFTITPRDTGQQVAIMNFGSYGERGQSFATNPADGRLELVVTGERSCWPRFGRQSEEWSVLPIKRVSVASTGEAVELISDGVEHHRTPATIEIVPKRLSIIVGRGRNF